MLLNKPDGVGSVRWLFKDVSVKAIIFATAAVVASHYAQATKIEVVSAKTEQRFADIALDHDAVLKRLDVQRDTIRSKVDMPVYVSDQARISEQLQAIQLSLNTIQQVLMQEHAK